MRCASRQSSNYQTSSKLHLIGIHIFTAIRTTDLYKYFPDTVPPIYVVSHHVATDKLPPPPKMATSSGLFLVTIYNQSQLAERKHMARYWLINTAATAVPLSVHPSPLVITTNLAAAILGEGLFGGGVLPAQYCPCHPDANTCGIREHCPPIHCVTIIVVIKSQSAR